MCVYTAGATSFVLPLQRKRVPIVNMGLASKLSQYQQQGGNQGGAPAGYPQQGLQQGMQGQQPGQQGYGQAGKPGQSGYAGPQGQMGGSMPGQQGFGQQGNQGSSGLGQGQFGSSMPGQQYGQQSQGQQYGQQAGQFGGSGQQGMIMHARLMVHFLSGCMLGLQSPHVIAFDIFHSLKCCNEVLGGPQGQFGGPAPGQFGGAPGQQGKAHDILDTIYAFTFIHCLGLPVLSTNCWWCRLLDAMLAANV